MGLNVIDWIMVILIIIGTLSILAFSVGYVWSVANKYYLTRANDRRLQKNNEIWLNQLFDSNCYKMMGIMQQYPDDFMEWIVSLPEGESEECIVIFDTYINLLNTCSLLEIHGVISRDIFWNKLELHLQTIAACKNFHSYILKEDKRLQGLKAKLLEMEELKK